MAKFDKSTKEITETFIEKMIAVKSYPTDVDYYQESQTWYSEIYESMICSRDRYRLLTIVLGFLLTVSIVSLMAIMPLKKYVYRIMEVNTQTGEVSELNELANHTITENWAVTRYFINQYVQNRNIYHYEDIKRSFNAVLAMSSKEIAAIYNNDIIDTNPHSPIVLLGKDNYRDVTILSQNKLNQQTAIIRFRTTTHNRNNLNDIKIEDFQVVIRWKYENSKESLSERDKNPLGFIVTYYEQSPLLTEN